MYRFRIFALPLLRFDCELKICGLRNYYLKILNLNKDAAEMDIKKSFRKLAVQYHPDKNPSPDANKKFIEICQAYEYLLQPEPEIEITVAQKESSIDFHKRYNKNLTPEEFAKKLKYAKEYLKRKEFTEENIREISFKQIQTSYIRKLSVLTCVISTIILSIITLDYLILKPVEKKGVLLMVHQQGFSFQYTIYDIEGSAELKLKNAKKNSDVYFKTSAMMDNEDWRYVEKNQFVKVYKSPLLDDLIGFSEADLGADKMIYNDWRFHLLFVAYFFIFSLPLITLIFKGANSFYIVFVYLTSYLSLITAFFFIFNLITYYRNIDV